MQGKFKLEQIWRWHHKDKEENDDSLSLFPESEISEVEINEILDPDSDITLDNVKWLLEPYGDNFRLFVRDYWNPGDQQIVDNEVKETYLNLLRYEPPADLNASDTIWRLTEIADIDSMSDWLKSRWRSRAVLAIRQEDKLQILCSEPYSEAGYCNAYCNPPKDSKHRKLCKKYGCT